jgi:hypothetical protein
MLNQVTTKHIEGSFQLTLALGNVCFSFHILVYVWIHIWRRQRGVELILTYLDDFAFRIVSILKLKFIVFPSIADF